VTQARITMRLIFILMFGITGCLFSLHPEAKFSLSLQPHIDPAAFGTVCLGSALLILLPGGPCRFGADRLSRSGARSIAAFVAPPAERSAASLNCRLPTAFAGDNQRRENHHQGGIALFISPAATPLGESGLAIILDLVFLVAGLAVNSIKAKAPFSRRAHSGHGGRAGLHGRPRWFRQQFRFAAATPFLHRPWLVQLFCGAKACRSVRRIRAALDYSNSISGRS